MEIIGWFVGLFVFVGIMLFLEDRVLTRDTSWYVRAFVFSVALGAGKVAEANWQEYLYGLIAATFVVSLFELIGRKSNG